MIRLEAFTPADYSRLIAWVDSPELLMQYAGPGFHFPLTEAQLAESASDPARSCYKVVDKTTGGAVGHAELYYKAESILICRLLIGDAQARGRGLGGAVIRALLSLARQDPQGRSISLNVFDWNVPAIRCYEREGFRPHPALRYVRQVGDETWTAVNMVYEER